MILMLSKFLTLPNDFASIVHMEKPTVTLSGENGNVYNVIGIVMKALRRSGGKALADEFQTKAFAKNSYDEVLALCFEYVEVE